MRARVADIKGEEVHVIVHVIGVAIELGVAVDLEMLAGVEQGPGRRGEADGADVKIVESRTALNEDVIDPGQRAFMSDGIDACDFAFEDVFGNAVEFDDNDAFYFSWEEASEK